MSSFGFRYGVTDNLSLAVWRSPSFMGRPIQIMAAYNLLDENREAPLNLAVRASIEGQNNFEKNFTELVAEIIPTLLHAEDLGIHRPVYSFGIQKNIWRHAFTLALTKGPGTTVSQRAGTRATFAHGPDKPSGLCFGFDITRQIQ